MAGILKINLFMILVLSFCCCSGYFTDNGPVQQAGMLRLAMEGGGYLSSDTANDITPFLFRDRASGNNYLFFASDRGGTYALYYAQMDPAGNFFNLTKMDPVINQPGTTNFSPVVFQTGLAWTETGPTRIRYRNFQ
ncbi:MAG: hypothetical protein ABSG94_08680 [Brevinematales bacterium]|jgi:hypothetical protein